MNRPSRLTVIAGAVGGLAITATAVAAVAMTSGAPETAEPSATPITQSASPSGESTTGVTGDHDDDREFDDSRPSEPAGSMDTITPEQAVTIAEQALAGHGAVPPFSEVERESEHGRPVWKVEFGDDHDVYVDAETGALIKVDVDDDADDRDDRHDDDRDDDDRHDDDWDDD